MTLYIVVGPPDCGKTTFCSRKTRNSDAYWVTCDLFTEFDFNRMSIDHRQYHIWHLVNYICEAAHLGKDVYTDIHLYMLEWILPILSARSIFTEIKITLLTSWPRIADARARYEINGWDFSYRQFERYHRFIMDKVIHGGMMLYGYSLFKERSTKRSRIYYLRSN